MGHDARVLARWAVWSKQPGSLSDYSVLACSSGPFSRANYSAIITQYAAGNPDSRAAGPGALPWVTVSWAGVDAGLHLGIAVTDPTEHVDGVGRPIARTSYFAVPYAALAAERVSYSALYRAVTAVTLPAAGTDPVELRVPGMLPDQAAERIEWFGERLVRGTAASLLTDPATVVQAEGSTLAERLEFIDAVVALLPYGFRANFTAATWSDSGVKHRIRLAFAARPREDTTAIAWRQPAGPQPRAPLAGRYLDELTNLSTGAATGRKVPLRMVVSHLAADDAARKFEQAHEAPASLRLIDQPFRLAQAALKGVAVDLSELRRTIRLGLHEPLEPEEREALLGELSRRGEAEDWTAIQHSLVRSPDVAGVRENLTAFGRSLLWSVKTDGRVLRECLTAAAGRGLKDDVLAGVLMLPEQAVPSARIESAASLLSDTGLVPGAYPHTRAQLADRPRHAARFLAALVGPNAGALLTWLDSPLLGPPFGVALGISPGDVTREQIESLAAIDIGLVRALLQTASRHDRLGAALPVVTRWLASRGEPGGAELGSWGTVLSGLAPESPRSRAWLDATLLALGLPPTAPPPPVGHPDSAPYLTDLPAIFDGLAREYSLFRPERSVQALARFLNTCDWISTEDQAAAVIELARGLARHDPEQELQRVIAGRLAASKAAATWPFTTGFISANGDSALASLELATPDDSPAELAALLVRAAREGALPPRATGALVRSASIDSAERAAEILIHVRQAFERTDVSARQTGEWLSSLVWVMGQQHYGRRFRLLAADAVSRQTELQVDLMLMLTWDASQQSYQLSEQVHRRLIATKDRLNQVAKRPLFDRFDRFLGRGGGDDRPTPERP